jgi:ATP-dependent Lon protease
MRRFANAIPTSNELVLDAGKPLPGCVPILPIRDAVLFPFSMVPLTVGRSGSLQLLDDLRRCPSDRLIGVLSQRDASKDDPGADELFSVGTLAVIIKELRLKDETRILFVQGLKRFRITRFQQHRPYPKAEVEYLSDLIPPPEIAKDTAAARRRIETLFEKVVTLQPNLSEDLVTMILNIEELSLMADFIASILPLESVAVKQDLLETLDVSTRLQKLQAELIRMIEIFKIKDKIQSEAQNELGKSQREYYLREQLKAIQKELGETDGSTKDLEALQKAILEAGLSEEAQKEATVELKRLVYISPASPEYAVIKTYLDWLVSLPWRKFSDVQIDIEYAASILDRDHHGLDKIKKRILEYLAVMKLKPSGKAPILCFVGPPGVGKTSLGKSIADALGRKFIRLSLGGMRDEAEIRGHRRTYIGSLPGQIIQGIRRAGERNPVFMLDEVDKIGKDFRGDPAAALLEVLDPEQNNSFRDHYLDVAFDLSKVLFITTANILDTIPPALLDRMEVIELHGYTEEEKIIIAQKYLLPRQAEQCGIHLGEHLQLSREVIRWIIRGYTREAGLRNLEREIGTICRKRARQLVEGEQNFVLVKSDSLPSLLGAPTFLLEEELEERTAVPGVAVGLAWTPTGGDILFVEASRMPGEKSITMTGQLGNVMQESVKTALSWVRAHARDLGIEGDFFHGSDIHIHVPSGAIPKDGPSAGITMVTALVSLLTNRPVRSRLAMTGEMTLTGKVLPIGGLKEKVLAAHRLGIRTVILPKDNRYSIEQDLPPEVADTLKLHFVGSLGEVLALALDLKLDSSDQDMARSTTLAHAPQAARSRA